MSDDNNYLGTLSESKQPRWLAKIVYPVNDSCKSTEEVEIKTIFFHGLENNGTEAETHRLNDGGLAYFL
jgi:hypothetical protein